jgi:hypothetical protein
MKERTRSIKIKSLVCLVVIDAELGKKDYGLILTTAIERGLESLNVHNNTDIIIHKI